MTKNDKNLDLVNSETAIVLGIHGTKGVVTLKFENNAIRQLPLA